jgi:outer membrane protein OmpA-like peptidoglycan-associated protein|tara:strand:+ start:437 stop:640 length:204 start_codon:yes stop_codon:yes gene_type:complete
LDKDDACPEVKGIVENKGCPKIEKEEEEILKRAFDNLEFESGRDVIKASSYSSLDELAVLMTKKFDD